MLLVSCITSPRHWPAKTNRVLELGSNKPLKNVLVVANWEGTAGFLGPHIFCYHVESTTTNEKGEFTIPSYTSFETMSSSSINLSFYSSKHKDASGQKIGPYYKHHDYYLEKFTGTPKERFKYLTSRGRGPSCGDGEKSRRNAFPFHKVVYEEAKLLAKTKEEKSDVKWLRERMASTIDTSYRKFTGDEQEKRINEILKEYESREQEK